MTHDLSIVRKPPKTLSAAVRLALHDLELVERDDRYIVKMGVWHGPTSMPGNPYCAVCFAGCVMVKTLELPIVERVDSNMHQFPSPWRMVFHSLDMFRIGEVHGALIDFTWLSPRNIVPVLGKIAFSRLDSTYRSYEYGPEEFKKWAAAVADILESEGF